MALLDLRTGTLVPGTSADDAVLEPTADAAALASAAATGGPIAIRFPTFGDGRGHSLAVLLRERHGFTGEIRAIGYLIPDLAPFLLRSGFEQSLGLCFLFQALARIWLRTCVDLMEGSD